MVIQKKDETVITVEAEECPICLATFDTNDDKEFVLSCECRFCCQCLCDYINEKVRNGLTNISCPNTTCPIFLTYEEIQKIGGDVTYERFLTIKLNQVIAMDPKRTWCPVPDCNTICNIVEIEATVDGMCTRTKCSTCPSCHHEFSPEEITKELMPWKILELNPNTKMCPTCNVLIERNGGYPIILCRYCLSVIQIEKGEVQLSLKSAFKQYMIKVFLMVISLIGCAISIKLESQPMGIFFGIMFTLLFHSDYDDGPDYLTALWDYRKIHRSRVEEEGLNNIILDNDQ